MRIRYYKEYSHNLNCEMEFKVYGHVTRTSMGRAISKGNDCHLLWSGSMGSGSENGLHAFEGTFSDIVNIG